MVIDGTPDVRLDEFDETEWRDIIMPLVPGLSDEAYHETWERFMAWKRNRERGTRQ